jgi:hypothetical protein
MDVAGSQTEAGHVRDEVAERTQKRFQVRRFFLEISLRKANMTLVCSGLLGRVEGRG